MNFCLHNSDRHFLENLQIHLHRKLHRNFRLNCLHTYEVFKVKVGVIGVTYKVPSTMLFALNSNRSLDVISIRVISIQFAVALEVGLLGNCEHIAFTNPQIVFIMIDDICHVIIALFRIREV